MTVETAALLTEPEARRLTLRIGLLLDSAAGVLDSLSASIREARDRRADLALGYGSWADYATAEFGERTAGLAPAIRRELVASLSVEVDGSPALSTRQIAPAVGVTQQAVAKSQQHPDVTTKLSPAPRASVVNDGPIEAQAASEAADLPPFDPTTGEVLDEPAPRPAVLGLDGKTYVRPNRPPAPRRERTDVVVEINKALNAAEEAAHHAERITAAHLTNRHEEATVWTRRLSVALETLERLNTSLQEASL